MEMVRIGILVNTHGIRGEMKVMTTTDSVEERFVKNMPVYIETPTKNLLVHIQYVKYTAKGLIVKFQEYSNINDIECYKGCNLLASIEDLPELEENEAYYFELEGCKVVDEQNEYIGEVSEVLETQAHAILRVQTDDKDVLIPFVDAFIIDFDRDEDKIIVRLLEGMR